MASPPLGAEAGFCSAVAGGLRALIALSVGNDVSGKLSNLLPVPTSDIRRVYLLMPNYDRSSGYGAIVYY